MDIVHTNNPNSLTLHIRITKKCNADCSYCSSFEKNAKDLMSLEHVKKSIEFIYNLILKYNLGGNRNSVTVQYIGGELLTVPISYLRDFCSIVETTISPLFKNFRQGCQTNLLGSESRISDLIDLFDANLGTSLDTFTNQRTLGKSPEKYKTFFLKNLNYTKKLTGKNLSSIIVLDQKMAPHIFDQVKYAEEKKMHITLRPVFSGGMPIESIENTSLNQIYKTIFDDWFMKSSIAIEPFFSLLEKRLLKHIKNNNNLPNISGCPFQHNCATSSLNMEPDGTLYVCLDMADSNHYPIGNAIEETINEDTFSLLLSRTEKLNKDCLSCDYFDECQGGCMNEAIEQQQNVFGKTYYCPIWKTVFKSIDDGILNFGITEVEAWVNKIRNTF
jgi:radical SAM protein with 4Fe4S-binding SPASM domain